MLSIATSQYPRGGPVELVVWFAAFALGFVALGLTAGSSEDRRSHFWARLWLGLIAVPSLALPFVPVLGPLSILVCIPALGLTPAFLYRRSGSPDSGEAEGGEGRGPDRPTLSPIAPRGGVPLPDADQAPARVRDHNGPRFGGPKPRVPAREPVRVRRPARWR